MKETEVAAPVVEYLRHLGWDVYQEVQNGCAGKIADIVAVLDGRIWVVESKTSLNLDLISQAIHWQRHAHWVSVAIPAAKRRPYRDIGPGRKLALRLLRDNGIGVFRVNAGEIIHDTFDSPPRLNRWGLHWDDATLSPRRWHLDSIKVLRGALRDEHRHWATAGNADGQRWSPWKATCKRAERFVKDNPGTSLKDLIDGIEHHYRKDSTARSSMSQWIQQGKVPGIEARREGRLIRLYPTR